MIWKLPERILVLGQKTPKLLKINFTNVFCKRFGFFCGYYFFGYYSLTISFKIFITGVFKCREWNVYKFVSSYKPGCTRIGLCSSAEPKACSLEQVRHSSLIGICGTALESLSLLFVNTSVQHKK